MVKAVKKKEVRLFSKVFVSSGSKDTANKVVKILNIAEPTVQC